VGVLPSAECLDYAFKTLQILLTTSTGLLTLSVAFVERLAGRGASRSPWLWVAWGALLLTVAVTVIGISQVVTVAESRAAVEELVSATGRSGAVPRRPRVPAPSRASQALDDQIKKAQNDVRENWKQLTLYAQVCGIGWVVSVLVLTVFTIRVMAHRPHVSPDPE
jgi:FtsH-binding integral membrane protein